MAFIPYTGQDWERVVNGYVVRRFPSALVELEPKLQTPEGIHVRPDFVVTETEKQGRTWVIECRAVRVPIGSDTAEGWIQRLDQYRRLPGDPHLVLAFSTGVTRRARERFTEAGFDVWDLDQVLGERLDG